MRLGQNILDQDLYEVLGVSTAATREQIRRAHRRLCFSYHPDLHPEHRTAAEERMKSINVAATVLLDPDARAVYDLHRSAVHSIRFAPETTPPTRPTPPASPSTRPQTAPPETDPGRTWTTPFWEPAASAFDPGPQPERPWWLLVPVVFFLVLGMLGALGSGPSRKSRSSPFRNRPLRTETPIWAPTSPPPWSTPSFDLPHTPDLSWHNEHQRLRADRAAFDRTLRRMNRAEQSWRRRSSIPSWSEGRAEVPDFADPNSAVDFRLPTPVSRRVPQVVDEEDPPDFRRRK